MREFTTTVKQNNKTVVNRAFRRLSQALSDVSFYAGWAERTITEGTLTVTVYSPDGEILLHVEWDGDKWT
jgi:hypothetical protein